MSDEAFLRAIVASPQDVATRLVYADWLEERGDSRGEFLRLACPLDDARRTSKENKRLEELTKAIDPQWVARVMTGRVWYHRTTFALLGEKLTLSKSNLRKIEKWERQHGMALPGSLREWYSFEGAEQRLQVDTEGFFPMSLQRLLNRASPTPGNERVGVPPGFQIGSWDTGECRALLNESDDPPVAVGGEREEGVNFSAIAFHRVWNRLTRSDLWAACSSWGYWKDYGSRAAPDFPLLQAEESAFGPRDRSHLGAQFTEGLHEIVKGRWREGRNPSTGETMRFFGPPSVMRFFVPGVRLKVVYRGDPRKGAKEEAYWEITADSEQQLFDAVAAHLWNHRTLSQTLTSPTQAGKKVLAKLRRRSKKG
jgi:uncharacterized protein (TIGR02996 family)